MSLLIKALHKAEQEKASEDKLTASAGNVTFELAPKDTGLEAEAGLSAAEPVKSTRPPDTRPASQKAAGVVFAAKNGATHSSTYALIAAGVLLLLIVAGAFYYYLESLQAPEVIMPARQAAATPATSSAIAAAPDSEVAISSAPASAAELTALDVSEQNESLLERVIELEQKVAEEQTIPAATPRAASQPLSSAGPVSFGEPVAHMDAGVKVTKHTPPPAINPNLQTAYDAFVAGDDTAAQTAYRRVLQADIRNTDALLGMAAIALRQGRGEDAVGWYNKVLEVDPRNSFAQAALAGLFSELDPVSAESRIKSLIALQPNTAHLYAALGSLYAGQGQWPQAQQAYFEAHRLAAGHAEHAFNLAVSLDQLGKSTLALQYYRQALSLLGDDGASSIDRAALELRIRQLQ